MASVLDVFCRDVSSVEAKLVLFSLFSNVTNMRYEESCRRRHCRLSVPVFSYLALFLWHLTFERLFIETRLPAPTMDAYIPPRMATFSRLPTIRYNYTASDDIPDATRTFEKFCNACCKCTHLHPPPSTSRIVDEFLPERCRDNCSSHFEREPS